MLLPMKIVFQDSPSIYFECGIMGFTQICCNDVTKKIFLCGKFPSASFLHLQTEIISSHTCMEMENCQMLSSKTEYLFQYLSKGEDSLLVSL